MQRESNIVDVFTTRKRSLGQGYIFTDVCHSVNRGVWSGGVVSRGCLLWGGCLLLGRVCSRPTPKGEFEGDQIQAHTQGGNWRGSDPPPTTTAVGGTHPTGMHSFYLWIPWSLSRFAMEIEDMPISIQINPLLFSFATILQTKITSHWMTFTIQTLYHQ